LAIILAIPYPAEQSIRKNPKKIPNIIFFESLKPYAFP